MRFYIVYSWIKRWLIIALLLLLGVWLLWPERNKVGNPSSEELVSQCMFPSTSATIRQYLGNGGATTGFWYTVTLKQGFFYPERQIFFAYSSPAVIGIACEMDRLTIKSAEKSYSFTYDEIQQLTSQPLVFYRGEISDFGIQPRRIVSWVAGGVFLLLAFRKIIKTI